VNDELKRKRVIISKNPSIRRRHIKPEFYIRHVLKQHLNAHTPLVKDAKIYDNVDDGFSESLTDEEER